MQILTKPDKLHNTAQIGMVNNATLSELEVKSKAFNFAISSNFSLYFILLAFLVILIIIYIFLKREK